MKLGSVPKQPGERRSFSIRYDDDLDEGDEVQQVDACTVEPGGTLTASPAMVSGQRVRVWVDGGTDGVAYKVTVKVTTTAGERLEDELIVKVKEI